MLRSLGVARTAAIPGLVILSRPVCPAVLATGAAHRPNLSSNNTNTSIVNIVGGVRYGSKKKREAKAAAKADKNSSSENKLDAKTLAAQRERLQARAKQKRDEARKEAKLRLESKEARNSVLCMDIPTALRYIRAAEVGNAPETTTITLSMRIVAEKGATPVNLSCRLPHPIGSERIAVFTNSNELAAEARRAGAVVVGGDELIDQVKEGKIDFDRAYATPDMTKRLLTVARILGPKGLMPNARRGTVTEDIFNAVSSAIGETTFKQHGNMLRFSVARASFTDLQIVQNILAVTEAIRTSLDSSENKKNAYIGKTVVTTASSPGIIIQV